MNKKVELLIVYKKKDEELFEHMKNLIETDDDKEGGEVVGVKDGTVKVYKCSEDEWKKHKKQGRENRLAEKVLFIGEIDDINIQTIDYFKYGISYGRTYDNQYAIQVDNSHNWETEEIERFFAEYKELFPEENDANGDEQETDSQEEKTKEKKKKGLLIAAGILFPPSLLAVGGVKISKKIKNDNEIRKQQLMLGITKLYYEELATFIEGK